MIGDVQMNRINQRGRQIVIAMLAIILVLMLWNLFAPGPSRDDEIPAQGRMLQGFIGR